MELGTYSDLTSFVGEGFPYYRTWQIFTFLFWVGLLFTVGFADRKCSILFPAL